jgi:hypothetical protein
MTCEDIQYDLRISATKFTQWIAQGLMPQPRIKEGGVTRWRTSEILDAIENFPNRDELEAERARHTATASSCEDKANPWADQRAK